MTRRASDSQAPEHWLQVPFDVLFENVTSSSLKLPTSMYRSAGKHPVIDQGEQHIGGFTDDDALVHPGPVPAVVFGDHTRCVKFASTPFVQGADGVKVLAPSPVVCAKYAYWALRHADIPDKGYARHFATLRTLQFSLPPSGEQHRIVSAIESYFTRLDYAVTTLERVQRNLKRYRASVLKAAVEGRLVPTEAALARAGGRDYEPASVLLERILAERRRCWEEAELAKMAQGKAPKEAKWKAKYVEPVAPDTSELAELPEGWCWANVDQLTTRVTSGSRDWSQFYGRGDSIFLMAQNVRPGELDLTFRQVVGPPSEDSSCERSQVNKDDLLVTIVGANTGNVCRVPTELSRHYVCQSVALMRLVDPSLSLYVDAYLNSPPGQQVYTQFMYGQGRPHLSFANLRETPVPLPPIIEQARIVEAVGRQLSVADAAIGSITIETARCARLRQSILNWAFHGRLVDQDPTDEPAARLLERIRAERESSKANPPRSPRRMRARSPRS